MGTDPFLPAEKGLSFIQACKNGPFTEFRKIMFLAVHYRGFSGGQINESLTFITD